MLQTGIFKNRWWMVFGAAIALMMNTGVVSNFAFAVFIKPITEDLHIGRATLLGATFIASICGTCVAPFFGKAIDYFGLRRVHLPMIFLFAIGTATLSLLQPVFWVMVLLFLCHGLPGQGQSPVGYSKALTAWFDKDRGFALGIAIAGVGLGVAVIPPFANAVIQNYGWRWAYVAMGAAILVLAFIPTFLFERDPPIPPERAHSAQHAPGIMLREAVKTWRFWAMTVAFFVAIVAINGTLTQVVALMTDRGEPLKDAIFALSMSGIALTVGRIVSGFCLDRFHGPYVACTFFLSAAIGVILLAADIAPFYGTVLCGLGIGAEVDLMAFLVSRYFGIRAFGAIYGLMFAIFSFGVGLGPFLMGVAHDYMHSYVPAMIAFEIGLIGSILALLPLGQYRFAHAREGGGVLQPAAAE
ncbi:MAG TPA: MFS transporter [Stellaceae bacterium]|nr:MFS transporter [Stellaceae bacterium]